MAGGGNQEENPVAINVVAMVDIIFCLCLFFMCSLKFKPLDAKFESWLPKNVGQAASNKMNEVIDEIRVVMSWNTQANRLERLFGQNFCPHGPEGDEKLKRLISESYKSFKAQGNPNVPLILDVGQMVPWDSVVHVVDIGKDAGLQKIQFSVGNAPDK
jgi:biopolymer transport protein ExbD